jgi:hypothetical protein
MDVGGPDVVQPGELAIGGTADGATIALKNGRKKLALMVVGGTYGADATLYDAEGHEAFKAPPRR